MNVLAFDTCLGRGVRGRALAAARRRMAGAPTAHEARERGHAERLYPR